MVSFTLGHAFTAGTPVEVTATVARLSDGIYVMQDKGTGGLAIRVGPTAALAIGSIRLLVRQQSSLDGVGILPCTSLRGRIRGRRRWSS